MTKVKAEAKYKNIPVKPDVYEQVALVAEAEGFGERGMGALVSHLVSRELPECDHKKVVVSIETYPSQTQLVKPVLRTGYFCETCKRVYAKISEEDLVVENGKKLFKAISGQRSAKKAVRA